MNSPAFVLPAISSQRAGDMGKWVTTGRRRARRELEIREAVYGSEYNRRMKIQRIYIDTSVIGGCFDSEFAEWSNGLIADFRNGIFQALLSEVIAAEVGDAPENVQRIYAELMSLNAEVLTVDESALGLAEEYQKRGILTPNFYDDGLHIALATIAEADLMVSWNFKHIVRFDKIRMFNAVNIEFGYKPLQIFSPREVTTYGQEEN